MIGVTRCKVCQQWRPKIDIDEGLCSACHEFSGLAVRTSQAAILRARRHGLLGRAADEICVDCGSQAEHWEHRAYGDALRVDPVCRSCNKLRGQAIELGGKLKADKRNGR